MDYGFVLKNYIRYRLHAKDEYSIHSPFMFDLFTKGLQRDADMSQYKGIDVLANGVAKSWLPNILRAYRRRVLFLCRLLDYFKPKTVLIVGNDGGVCAAYFARTLSESRIFNVLCDEKACKDYEAAFKKNSLINVSFVCANGGKGLEGILEKIGKADFVLLNGENENGDWGKTMEEIMPSCDEEGVVVLGDIRCKRELNELWERVRRNERFRVCADFFLCGAAFLTKRPLKRQYYVLKRR